MNLEKKMTPEIPWIHYVIHYGIMWLSWLLWGRCAIWCWCRAAVARASSLGGGCSPTLRSYPANSPSTWRGYWVLRNSLLPSTFSDSKVLSSRGRQLTCISSLKSEYALKGSLALRQLPGCTGSGHIMPQFKPHIPEQARGRAPKSRC